MIRFLLVLITFMVAGLARDAAAQWPGQCPSGVASTAIGCQPAAVTPLATDLLSSWQVNQAPKTRAMQVQQILTAGLPGVFSTLTAATLNVTGNLSLSGAVTGPFSIANGTWIPSCPAGNCSGSFAAPNTQAQFVQDSVSGSFTGQQFGAQFGMYNNTGIGLGPSNLGQRVTLYAGHVQGQSAGPGWAANFEIIRCANPSGWNGTVGSGTQCTIGQHVDTGSASTGLEIDLSNFDQNAPIGGSPFVAGIVMYALSAYTSTAAIYVSPTSGYLVPSFYDGLLFQPGSVSDNVLLDTTNASYTIQSAGSHVAAFYDVSTSTYGLQIAGTHSNSDIYLNDAAPIGVRIANAHATAAISDESTGGVGLRVTGTKTAQAILLQDSSPYAFYISGARATGTYVDVSTGASGILLAGTKTGTDLAITSMTPTAIATSGTHTTKVWGDSSTSPTAINLTGTYASGAYVDSSTGASGILLAGTKTGTDLAITSMTPIAIATSGTHTTNVWGDSSTSANAAINLTGTYALGAIITTGATITNSIALNMATGQKACFALNAACIYYSTGAGKWYITDEANVIVASIAKTTGNVIFKGTVTASGSP